MNRIVDRESNAMRSFASEACNIADALESVCSHLRQELSDASGCMQDDSGQNAIMIVHDLVEETVVAVSIIRSLSDRIRKSAELLEESDTLL